MTYDELCRVVRDVLSPERFYAKADANVRLVHRPPKPMRFEVFQGQLLGPNQTRQERELESYDVIIERQAVAEGFEP